MRTDSVKKYVIPNIPYLFILWACLPGAFESPGWREVTV